MRKKTLFLGNGICRTFAEKPTDWKDLLVQTFASDMNSVNQFEEYVPYYMYPLLHNNGQSISEAIRRNKEKFYGFDPNDDMIGYVRKLLELGFDDIITTNYSYEIERCILGGHISNEKLDKVLANNMKNSIRKKRVEQKYMLHSYLDLNTFSESKYPGRLWHIHGEARKPDSIVLGIQWYGNLLGKVTTEMKRIERSINARDCNADCQRESWIRCFFDSGMYILGFGLDYSEIDIWWILNSLDRKCQSITFFANENDCMIYEGKQWKEDKTKKKIYEDHKKVIEKLGINFVEIPVKPDYKASYKASYKAILEDDLKKKK